MTVAALQEHLQTGVTHTCRCWVIRRSDGVTLGFTDHDAPLSFEGIAFAPQRGLSARAIASTTGLSVNNTEALGVLSDDSITEVDILTGRYDGAAVQLWLVCWDDVAARKLLFRGCLGEITRTEAGFEAELHGLTEALNQPRGRSYLKSCSAVLGDSACKFAVAQAAYQWRVTLPGESEGQSFILPVTETFADGWFTNGLLEVVSGQAAGMKGVIKSDVLGQGRRVVLWAPLNIAVQAGDVLRLTAGCDKRPQTCREKFANFVNFQGFPDIPGDEWLVSVPRSDQPNTGGSLTR